MKKTSLLYILLIFATSAFASLADYKCPRLNFQSEADENAKAINANIRLAVCGAENPALFRRAAISIFTDTRNNLAKKITTPASVAKSAKFVKLANLTASAFTNAPVVKIGNIYVLIFDIPQNSRLRRGMNFLVFEMKDGIPRWNIATKDPLISLLLQADFKDITDFDASKIPTDSKEKVDTLVAKNLPMLTFNGAPLVNLDKDPKVYEHPTAKFYKEAQKLFFDLKLDEYSKSHTPLSMKNFRAQFMPMSLDAQKKMLADYMSWGKQYLKIADGGDFKILFFKREKDGEKSHVAVTYFEEINGSPYIWGVGANKSAFDMFLSRYFLSSSDYEKSLSIKFCR